MSLVFRVCLLFSVLLPALEGQGSQTGQWAPLVSWPFVPVSIAHLSDGRVVAWASTQPISLPSGPTSTYAAIYDPLTGQIGNLNHTAHDMFCAGMASTGDGRIIVSGGGADVRTTSTIGLIPRWPETWRRMGDMVSRRWYNSSVALDPAGVQFSHIMPRYLIDGRTCHQLWGFLIDAK